MRIGPAPQVVCSTTACPAFGTQEPRKRESRVTALKERTEIVIDYVLPAGWTTEKGLDLCPACSLLAKKTIDPAP